ncbi:MAG: peptide chain release factor N(5)-glutamine methyltransferase [Pseudomonadota bacterium]|jgi:release factor glutamine methyltransferase
MRDSAEQFSRLRDAVTAAVSTLERALQPPADVPMGDIPDLDVLREAETLVLHALGMPRSTLYADPDRLLSEQERVKVQEWLARRGAGVPLAYLTGGREFWSLEFEVSPAVLVPRPETELLVERALRAGDALELEGNALPRILDLGTGSGAIAIAIAHERPGWRVSAVERSTAALAVARRNASRHAVANLELLQGDWFTPVSGRRFEVVVSNPPYVSAGDPLLSGDSLRHEPREALTPGADAFRDLSHLVDEAPRHLERGGTLLLEHGARQGEALRRILVSRGFAHVVSLPDLSGQERVTEGRWP